MSVEPVHGQPAAVAETGGTRLLVLADFHAGIERAFSRDGVELASAADERREQLHSLVAETEPDRLVVLGDLGHEIGEAGGSERAELVTLLESMPVPVTVVKGNHDGDIESLARDVDADVTVAPTDGTRIGDIGLVHGHTWPREAVLSAEIVCVGHEHPVVRLEDSVGGHRVERVWLRGDLDPVTFEAHEDWGLDEGPTIDGDLVVFPAFNDRSSGTWVNVEGQEFLAPFLPTGLANGEAYLLDGTRLGPYDLV
jgi:putative SbcD/Mre11-related phosphoesterase